MHTYVQYIGMDDGGGGGWGASNSLVAGEGW